jgi:hypothetical protein
MLDVATLTATAVEDSTVGRLSEVVANSTVAALRSTAEAAMVAGSTADAAKLEKLSLVRQYRPAAMTAGLFLCAEHVRQLEGESPFDNLMEVKS